MVKYIVMAVVAMFMSLSSSALSYIVSPGGCCVGATVTLTEADTSSWGGTWVSSNPSVATVGYSSGVVSGISAGTAVLTYTFGAGYVTSVFTVTTTTPGAISGPSSLCAGVPTLYTDPTPGGTWASSTSYVVSINALTGSATGAAAGSAAIYYVMGPGCQAMYNITNINTASVDTLYGPSNVCEGATATLVETPAGGTWSSSNTSIATVTSGGIVTGVLGGTVNITYAVTTSCGYASAVHHMAVTSASTAGAIAGASMVYIGFVTTLTDAVYGGAWSSSNPSVASVNSSTGVVTGIAAGSATITYTGCAGVVYTTFPMTVSVFTGISGRVFFAPPTYYYYGNVKVWLIHYDPGALNLIAFDSTVVYCSGANVYYEFNVPSSDSFRIKAAIVTSGPDTSSTGNIPTYHNSSFYWHDANVVYHTAGVGDTGENITMLYGIPTGGAGFIGGSVLTGANKGTSGGTPVNGLEVVIMNSTTGAIIQRTYTNTTGSYSFSNLPVGQTYTIFPDSLNYLTTAYTSINLTTAAPSMSAASFIQHTLSKTITPITSAVANVSNSASSVFIFPNPSNGKVNIQSGLAAAEKATVTVTDITGREIFKTALDLNKGTAVNQLDLSALTNGLYMISVKSASLSYNGKIQMQH